MELNYLVVELSHIFGAVLMDGGEAPGADN